jgi:hypothetical protein
MTETARLNAIVFSAKISAITGLNTWPTVRVKPGSPQLWKPYTSR